MAIVELPEMEYHWRYLPTGATGVSKFRPVQNPLLLALVGNGPALEREADKLIEEWNKQHPDTWQYWRDK